MAASVKITDGKETVSIPAADLKWFKENGWKEVGSSKTKTEAKTK